jgi:hypothetical protein
MPQVQSTIAAHTLTSTLAFVAGLSLGSYLQTKETTSTTSTVITERDRVYLVERGAEDDATDLALSEHQEVNYVRCYLRHAGFVTCQVHTPPNDIEATCRARTDNEMLVDGTRCRWNNPETMAHP